MKRNEADPPSLECGDSSPLLRRRLVAVSVPCASEPARPPAPARAVSGPFDSHAPLTLADLKCVSVWAKYALIFGMLIVCVVRSVPAADKASVYGKDARDLNELFDVLNTHTLPGKRLRQSVDLTRVEKAISKISEDSSTIDALIGDAAFTEADIPFDGEREWPLIVNGSRHVLLSPKFEQLLAAIDRCTSSKETWRRKMDVLQLARFQNDIWLTVKALAKFSKEEHYLPAPPGTGTARSNTLIDRLNVLLDACLLTDTEIGALPDTDDLDCNDVSRNPDWTRMYFRWTNAPTVHEQISMETYYNELYVLYSKTNAPRFTDAKVLDYVNHADEIGIPATWVMLDRLNVLDTKRQVHRTKVTALARVQVYGSSPARPWGLRIPSLSVSYLRRKAPVANWRQHIEPDGPDEMGGISQGLPNIPGVRSIYAGVQLRVSCLFCHLGPRIFTTVPQIDPRPYADPRRLYRGITPFLP